MRRLVPRAGDSPLEQLRTALAAQLGRVIDLFRAWDDDDNGRVSRREFHRALPALGLLVDRAAAEALFDELDADGSGEVDYEELEASLRAGGAIELGASLQPGAMGEISGEARNRHELRRGTLEADVSKVFGRRMQLDAAEIMVSELGTGGVDAVLEQLQQALAAPGVLARAVDLFRAWDDDSSGLVDRAEFARALPALGLRVGRETADELFDALDTDGSGLLEYRELHARLRKRAPPLAVASARHASRGVRRGGRDTARSLDGSPRLLPELTSARSQLASVRQAQDQEREQERALTRLRARLAHVEHEGRKEAHRLRRAMEVQAVREEMDVRVGKDLAGRVGSVKPASDERLAEVARAFHEALLRPNWAGGRTWFHLWNLIDADHSGRISYAELRRACRGLLEIGRKALPDRRLQATWRRLDVDGSGFIDTGEFGQFMRLGKLTSDQAGGAPTAPLPADPMGEFEAKMRAKFKAARSRVAEGGNTVAPLAERLEARGVPPASDELVLAISRLVHHGLMKQPPSKRLWYTLFKGSDADGSGLLNFDELCATLRETLHIPKAAISDAELQSLWISLSAQTRRARQELGLASAHGQVDAATFGRFCKLATGAAAAGAADGAVGCAPSHQGATPPAGAKGANAPLHDKDWRPGRAVAEPMVGLDRGAEDPEAEEERSYATEVDRAKVAREQMAREMRELERLLKEKESRLQALREVAPPPPPPPPPPMPQRIRITIHGGTRSGMAAPPPPPSSKSTSPEVMKAYARRARRHA